MDRSGRESSWQVTSREQSYVDDCPFCAIARGDDPSVNVVHEASAWMAFFPDHPATPGHTLIIPRWHVVDLWEADSSLGDELMGAAIRVGRAIKASLNPDGLNLITSAGEAAEQTIFHLHLHLVPRWDHDGFGQIWPDKNDHDPPALVEAAGHIRSCLE